MKIASPFVVEKEKTAGTEGAGGLVKKLYYT